MKQNNRLTPDQIAEEGSKHFDNDDKSRAQITSIEAEIKGRVKDIKREMYRIGGLLAKAKQILNHGEFKQWIEERFDFSYQTANNFMNVYRVCLGRPSLVQTVKASVLYQIAAPSFPPDLREHIFSSEKKLKKISNKQIRKVMKRYKKGKLDLDSPEIQSLFEYQKSKEEWETYSEAVQNATDSVRQLRDTIVRMCKNITWPRKSKDDKLKVSQETADTLNDFHNEMKQAIINIRPKLEIDDSLKPKFRIDPQ